MSHYYRSTQNNFSSRSQRMYRRGQNTVAFAPKLAMGPISHTILIALMVAVLGLIYITQVTKTSSFSYAIDEREKQLTALKLQKKNLQNKNTHLQALSNVAHSDVAKAMTTPAATSYARN